MYHLYVPAYHLSQKAPCKIAPWYNRILTIVQLAHRCRTGPAAAVPDVTDGQITCKNRQLLALKGVELMAR